MFNSTYTFIITIAISMSLYSCVSFEIPPNSVNKNELKHVNDKILHNSKKAFDDLIKNHSRGTYNEETYQYCKYNKLLKNVINKSNYKFESKKDNFKLVIVDTDGLIITSFLPYTVVISSSIIESRSKYFADDETVYGLFAHEVCHLGYGHTEARNRWQIMSEYNTGKIIDSDSYKIFNILSPVKIYRSEFNDKIMPNYDYSNWFFESSADLFALKAMNNASINPRKYLSYFEKINHFLINESKEIENSNKERIVRLSGYFVSKNSLEMFYDLGDVNFAVYKTGYIPEIFKSNYISKIRLIKSKNKKLKIYNSNYELYRSINFWKIAAIHNDTWSRINDNHYRYFVGHNGKPIKEDGIPIRMCDVTIPISIDGYESFVFLYNNIDYEF